MAASQPAVSQDASEAGLPFLTNYGSRDYDAGDTNWGITQDDRGIMYFANQLGVLEFDGTNWRLIELEFESTARSVMAAPDGRVYVGGVRTLGYLAPDSTGMLAYVSLLDEIPEADRGFTDVWHMFHRQDGVFFFTDDRIFRWADGGFKIWRSPTPLHVGFQVRDELYVRQWGTGLMRVDEDSLRLVPGGDRFPDERIYVMLPFGPERAIVVTRTMGVFLYDGDSFEPFETEIDEWLAENLIYLPGTALRDGGFALATISGGVAIINRDGSLRRIIDQASGIRDNGVVFTYQDAAGDLWLGMTDGISRLEISSPFTIFDGRSGFRSRLTDVERFDDNLFAASQSGIYRYNRDTRFWDVVPGTNNQVFDIEPFAGRLMVATGLEGLNEYYDGELRPVKQTVDNSFSVGIVDPSIFDSTRIFIGLLGGIGSFRLGADGQWIDEGLLPDYNYTRFSIVEESKTVAWAGGPDGPLIKLNLVFRGDTLDWTQSTYETYDSSRGADDNGGGLFKMGDDLFAGGGDTLKIYNREKDRFEYFDGFDMIRTGRQGGGYNVGPDGRVWMNGGANIVRVTINDDGSFDVEDGRFDAIAHMRPGSMLPEENGIAWIETSDGLIRYDESLDADEGKPVSALIRSVTAPGDSLIYAGETGVAGLELPYSLNSLRFGYSSTNYRRLDLNEFQTRLVGFETDFTDWTSETRRDFTNLNPGNYSFEVRTRTATGNESGVSAFTFTVLPPWYLTWWAMALYILAFVLVVGGVIALRTRQLRKRQAELEQTVDERTAEINQRIEELAVINSVQEGLVAEMDIQGIYDLVGERMRNLFDAQVVVIRTYDREDHAEVFNYAIEKGERLRIDPRPMDTFAGHVAELRDPLVLNEGFVDYLMKFEEDESMPAGEVPKSAVFVPLIVGDTVRGNISLQNVDHENAFSDSDVRLLTTLANSMSVALENARLFDQTSHLLEEADLRAEELGTVNRISKALVAQLDLDALIQLIGSQIQELFKADMAYVAIHNKETNTINFPYGYGDEFPPMQFGEGFTTQIIQTGRPLLINEDVSGSFEEMGIEEVGRSSASYLGVPVSVGSEVIGVISVQSESQTGRFDDGDQRLLSTIAANVGVALANAEAYQKLNETLVDLKSTQEQLVTQEKMASLGQLTAGIAHEIKNPLNFVNNFAELISELAKEAGDTFDENRSRIPDDLAAELIPLMSGLAVNAQQVHKHGKRADGIVKSMMDHATGGSGERYRVEVNPMVEEYMQLAYHGMRAQVPNLEVNLHKQLDPAVGTLDMAPREIGRVIVNLVNNAIYAVHERAGREGASYQPEVRVTTQRQNGSVRIAVSDNGPGIPSNVREKIFEPLFTTKPTGSGTGLGLSLSFDIVTQAHGGRLEFESQEGDGTTFFVTLPARV